MQVRHNPAKPDTDLGSRPGKSRQRPAGSGKPCTGGVYCIGWHSWQYPARDGNDLHLAASGLFGESRNGGYSPRNPPFGEAAKTISTNPRVTEARTLAGPTTRWQVASRPQASTLTPIPQRLGRNRHLPSALPGGKSPPGRAAPPQDGTAIVLLTAYRHSMYATNPAVTAAARQSGLPFRAAVRCPSVHRAFDRAGR
jgi:hypothetical protein